nr:alpha/beta fold hydrolase [Cochlodiniinecator piscidefendens]
MFGPQRSEQLSFARYDISIPDAHDQGNIEWSSDADDGFIAVGSSRYETGRAFQSELRKSLQALPRQNRSVTLYVHGFNNTFADGVYRLAQMTHDYELSGVSVHYSWPSGGHPLGYGYDRDSMLFARDGLEQTLALIHEAGAQEIVLIGHSMGALLSMETLRQMSISRQYDLDHMLGGVVLISPDIDVEVFQQQAHRIGQLPQPFVIFSSSEDHALRLSARLTGLDERLGNITEAQSLSDLHVTIIDVTDFSNAQNNHFATATSPALIQILNALTQSDEVFEDDRTSRLGLLPGTVLTVQNATQIILSQ